MNRTVTISTIVGITLSGTGLALFLQLRKKRRDEKAALFLSELERRIDPVESVKQSAVYDTASEIISDDLLPEEKVRELAKNIYDAIGIFTDDEAMIYSQLEYCRNKAQVQQVNKAYFELFHLNLFRHLEENLNGEEMEEVGKIINAKDY